MTEPPPLHQTVCLNYCAYYKPGKPEELACRGYTVVGRLRQSGKIKGIPPSGNKPDRALSEALVQKMCTTCDFFENDCDFMMDRTAPPCGGFAVLVQLIALETLKMEDIE